MAQYNQKSVYLAYILLGSVLGGGAFSSFAEPSASGYILGLDGLLFLKAPFNFGFNYFAGPPASAYIIGLEGGLLCIITLSGFGNEYAGFCS